MENKEEMEKVRTFAIRMCRYELIAKKKGKHKLADIFKQKKEAAYQYLAAFEHPRE